MTEKVFRKKKRKKQNVHKSFYLLWKEDCRRKEIAFQQKTEEGKVDENRFLLSFFPRRSDSGSMIIRVI